MNDHRLHGDRLTKLSEAMQRGRISYSKVRAMTRVATPANENRLLDFALCDCGPTRLDNLVLLCRRHHRAVHEEGFT